MNISLIFGCDSLCIFCQPLSRGLDATATAAVPPVMIMINDGCQEKKASPRANFEQCQRREQWNDARILLVANQEYMVVQYTYRLA